VKTGASPSATTLADAQGNGDEEQAPRQQPPTLPQVDPKAQDEEVENEVQSADGGATAHDESKAEIGEASDDGSSDATFLPESPSSESGDDEDFLDLLVDTLDGDFDPNLLI
jgi:hypothetical protein